MAASRVWVRVGGGGVDGCTVSTMGAALPVAVGMVGAPRGGGVTAPTPLPLVPLVPLPPPVDAAAAGCALVAVVGPAAATTATGVPAAVVACGGQGDGGCPAGEYMSTGPPTA